MSISAASKTFLGLLLNLNSSNLSRIILRARLVGNKQVRLYLQDITPSIQFPWTPNKHIFSAIEDFTAFLEWNKSSFGNIFKEKKTLLARLKGIQMSPRYLASTFLYYLEIDLINKYNEILRLF